MGRLSPADDLRVTHKQSYRIFSLVTMMITFIAVNYGHHRNPVSIHQVVKSILKFID